MTEETTSHPAETESAYYNVTLRIGEKTLQRLLAATQVSHAASPVDLVNISLTNFLKQIEMAYAGTILRQVDTLTLASDVYKSESLTNAFLSGETDRENSHMKSGANVFAFKAIPGGKAV
jgi:hypothetical protein